MPGPIFFAWCNEGDAFSAAMEVDDEDIFALELSQQEGDFASLIIDVINPRVGLLAAGRELWCWLSWKPAGTTYPLFHGRLLGVEEDLHNEVVQLHFVAKPGDYAAQKAALAETLKVAPYWDPIWIQREADDPDTVLESRTQLWDIDRITLAVTAADLLAGDDGTIEVNEVEHFYDGMKVGYAGQPMRRVKVKGTLTWTQTGGGEVDITLALVRAFRDAGSPFQPPLVSSFTSGGLLDDWPEPAANMGGGWTMASDSSAVAAQFVASSTYPIRWTDKSNSESVTGFDDWQASSDSFGSFVVSGVGPEKIFHINWKIFEVTLEMAPVAIDFRVTYAAERKRSEVVEFTVEADIQSILTDPGAAEEAKIELSSIFVDQPVDPDGALPIGDARRNSYLPTDRGKQSLEALIMIARAKLLTTARAVDIDFDSTWEKLAVAISCRKSVLLIDGRIPGGQAVGKIKSYQLVANGEGMMTAKAKIGCSIGYGVLMGAAAAGVDVYATDYSTGYTARTGAEIDVIANKVRYESLDGTYVIDDDGVDLFNMAAATVVNSLTITDGPTEQRWTVDESLTSTPHNVRLRTRGDILLNSVENLESVEGLVDGTAYTISGGPIPNPFTISFDSLNWSSETQFLMTFNGTDGGSLNHPVEPTEGVYLSITTGLGQVLTPDPLGALKDHPTVVTLDLVPVSGGDFLTEYAVTVLDLVVGQGINLESPA